MCALYKGSYTANYRGCQLYKDLQRLHYGKTIPKTNTSKPNLNYSQILNEGGNSSDGAQRDPPNINDNLSFINLTQNTHNSHYQQKNTNILPPNDPDIALQLSSFINEFKY